MPDIDTLELYEWAAWDFIGGEIEYADTLGPLRVRWAKANPKSPVAIQCLRSCLEYWDLVSAQQVSCCGVWGGTPGADGGGRFRRRWTGPMSTRATGGTCFGALPSPFFFQ